MTTQEFNNLPTNEKAVLVAKDVLKQIKTKNYIANNGTYISFIDNIPFKGSIKENFKQLPQCRVCALGSILLSSTHLGNVLTTNDVINNPDAYDLRNSKKISKLFKTIFTNKQLLLIETAFEGYSYFWEKTKKQIKKEYQNQYFHYYESSDRYANIKETLTFDEVLNCEMFNRKYIDDEKRLNAICKNIIKNNGVFKP